MKITYLASAPLPYDTPILNELARMADLHVLYMHRAHSMYHFRDGFGQQPEFSWSTHPSLTIRRPGTDFWTQVSVGVGLRLERLRPDVVLAKSWNPFVAEAVIWKAARRRAFVMWSESTSRSGLHRGWATQFARRSIMGCADQIVTNGTEATDFLVRELEIASNSVVTSCLPSGLADQAVKDKTFQRIGQYDEESPRFLFVGRLVSRKQPRRLLDAFRVVQSQLPNAQLTIVGDG